MKKLFSAANMSVIAFRRKQYVHLELRFRSKISPSVQIYDQTVHHEYAPFTPDSVQ
jgi:hypothetical protein